MKLQQVKIGDYSVRFERRNYPKSTGGVKTFTWAEAMIGGQWVSLGDPWECLRPKNSELLQEINRRIVK